MDISNVQRTNLMIKELTKHGRVESFDQALNQSQELFGELPQTSVAQEAGAIQTEQPLMKASIDEQQLNSLLRDKLGSILSAYNDGVMKEIEGLHAQIASLRSEMLNSTPATVHAAAEERHPAVVKNEKAGNFTSDDVSVEKVFYCGDH